MKSFDENQFRNNLVAYRVRKGLTQYRVAELLNVHPKTVGRWENNPTQISLETLDTLAIVYGIKVRDFFTD